MPLETTLAGLVREAWFSLVGESEAPVLAPHGKDVLAFIQFAGAGTTTLTFACDLALARHAASTIFGLPPEEVSDGDVADALGEFANVVGGQLKAYVDPTAQLSLPAVMRGTDDAVWVPGSIHRGDVYVEACGLRIHAQLLERARTARPTVKTHRLEAGT